MKPSVRGAIVAGSAIGAAVAAFAATGGGALGESAGLAVALASVALVVAVAWLLDLKSGVRLQQDLDRLARGFRAAEGGDLSYRIAPARGGAAEPLAVAFNAMIARLEATTIEARAAHDRTARALERVQMVTDAARLGIWYRDLADGRREVNETYVAMLGETIASFDTSREAFRARVHPDDVRRLYREIDEHLAGVRESVDTEFRMRHRDGSWRWIAAYGRVAERDSAGRPLAIGGTHRDVTALRMAEAERDAQQRLLASLSSNQPGVLHRIRIEADGIGRFEFLGGNARELFGVDRDVLTPAMIGRMRTPESYAATRELFREAIATRGNLVAEFEIVCPDGRRRWIRSDSCLVASDARSGTWDGIFIDLTDEVVQRRELEVARQQADAASRAKSAFLSSVSHELRTPMTGILGYASMIERLSTEPQVARMAGTVRKSAQRLTALLNDVLDAAQIEAGELTVRIAAEQVRGVVDEACELFAPAAQSKGLRFTWQVEDPVPATIDCDGMRLRQILQNLLSNAVKFTVHGDIRVRVHVGVDVDGNADLRIDVADTGPGIPEASQSRMFERFRQADERVAYSHGGTGLGLALSREFARRMGGDVVLASREGKGTTVTVVLPLAGEVVPAA